MQSVLASKTYKFWTLSKAWKRDPNFMQGHTYQTLLEGLCELSEQGRHHVLRRQAEDLSALIVKGKIRRKKGAIKSKVIRAVFVCKDGGKNQARQARYAA